MIIKSIWIASFNSDSYRISQYIVPIFISFTTQPEFQWITASIGIHHVHHINARIPNYKLQECMDNIPYLQNVTQISLWDGIKTLRLSLWNEDDRKLVSFSEARRLVRT